MLHFAERVSALPEDEISASDKINAHNEGWTNVQRYINRAIAAIRLTEFLNIKDGSGNAVMVVHLEARWLVAVSLISCIMFTSHSCDLFHGVAAHKLGSTRSPGV